MTSVDRRREQDDSGEYSDASQDIEQNNSVNDGGQPESDYDSRGTDSEHSDREEESQKKPPVVPEKVETEESQTERRVDDDEDRSNPQYIPKRGTFYEHDDRTAASGEESTKAASEPASEKEGAEPPPERRRAPRKSDTINKWSHDKYNENEQMPKSRDELVAIYGYDIRNEDAPPHARRNRRYGRGPNKYTRTWEDEEAYRRQTAAAAHTPPHRKPPSMDDFPELDAKITGRRPRPRPRSKSQPASNDSSDSGSLLRRHASTRAPRARAAVRPAAPAARPAPVREKLPPLEKLTISGSVFNNSNGPQRKANASAQQRPVPTEQARRRPPQQQQQQGAPVQAPPAAAAGGKPQQQAPQQQQPALQQKPQQQQPATGGEARGGSKRYSSMRQRPLAETYSPQQKPQPQQQQQPQPQPQQQQPQPQQPQTQQQQPQPQQSQQQPHRYHGEFVSGAPAAQHQGSPVPQIHPQQIMHQVHRSSHGPSPPHALPLAPPAPHLDPQQQVRLGILEQQQMVSHPHHSIHQTHTIGQLQPPQAYAPPAIMPTQYMQQQSGAGGAVYGGGMYQPPAAYPHQMYPHHNFQQATQAGGVTYYSCAEQEQQPRAQRRPTAAIPIVRPAAPHAAAPAGPLVPASAPAAPPAPAPTAPAPAAPAAAAAQPDRPANSTEKDNIDRIVENMFVRKPWPATAHGVDAKDSSKTEQQRSGAEASVAPEPSGGEAPAADASAAPA